jgi:phosphonoacetaldehyde hydrolase
MKPFAQGIQAVIFDWAGTTVDYGSRAPTEAFAEIFRRNGVDITIAEARGPMGRSKRDHIAAIFALPRVAEAWNNRHGKLPQVSDIDRMYVDFLPLQEEIIVRHCDVIPGVPETVAECRRRGMKIGSSTGYTRALMEIVTPLARAGGYEPDVVLCADDVPQGRPAPWLIFRAAERLNVFPVRSLVIVDDTPVGIEAGVNAGAWTVAVTKTGNCLGLSQQEVNQLSQTGLQNCLATARAEMQQAGADYVIDSVADLLPVLDEIEERLKAGR